MSADEKRKFIHEFEKIKDELCDMVIKITNGCINSFKLRSQPKLIEHIDDIIQDAVINVFRYINRFDEERGSSAFAYVTQLISNAIKLDLKKIEEHNDTYISGVDYFDNLNTVDDPHDGVNGLANFIE
jgi:DNA-directed RNA polymerase specialized sigma subunit